MFVLLVLCLLVGCLILVPLLILGFVLRLFVGLLLIPFQLAGFAIRLGLGLAVGLVGLILAGAVLLIPLLPIVFLVGGIWLIVRLSRRHPAAGLAA